MQRIVIAIAVSGMVFVASTAHAQERGRVGLSMGYPGRIDLMWHATNRIVIRPGASWTRNSSNFSGLSVSFSNGFDTISSTTSETGTNVGIGVNVLLSVGTWENVHAYVAPGYEYRRSGTTHVDTTTSTGATTEHEMQETRGHDHVISGIFGVRYVPHRRFGVFGESGIEYSDSRSTFADIFAASGDPFTLRTWGTATRVGAIFYF